MDVSTQGTLPLLLSEQRAESWCLAHTQARQATITNPFGRRDVRGLSPEIPRKSMGFEKLRQRSYGVFGKRTRHSPRKGPASGKLGDSML